MTIINQDKILNVLNKYDAKTLPKALLFIGEEGSGKHIIAKYLAGRIGFDLIDFTENISFENICDIYINPIPCFYLIDLNKISIKEQNAILKFIEEPASSCYIILIATNESYALETVSNRCVKYILNPYTKDDLIQFLENKSDLDILDICTTPGQVLKYKVEDIKKTDEFALKLIDNIDKAKLSNVLTLSRFISKESDKEKYDVNLLVKLIKKNLYEKVIQTNDIRYSKALELTLDFIKILNYNYDLKKQLDLYIIKLNEIMRDIK